jgi:hypothetical protein
MNLREHLPPTVVTAARLVRTRLTLSGLRDRRERTDRDAAVAAIRALPGVTPSGSRVLVFSLRGGWPPHIAWEAVIAEGLTLRGARVHVFNCGGRMPICEVNFRHADPRVACAECRLYPEALHTGLALETSWLATYLTASDRQEIGAAVARLRPSEYESWTFDGRPIGVLVRNSVLWFLRKSRPDLASGDARVYRDFLIAGAQIARMAPRLLAAVRPELIVEVNGLFFAEQILNSFVPPGCRIATYEAGWRTNTLGFDWLSAAGFADVDAAWERLADRPLTPEESATLDAWIGKRRGGDMQRDFYVRFDTPAGGGALAALGLAPHLPTAVLYTNLVWDTAVFGRDIAFSSIAEWLRDTVEWFRDRTDRQLVIRIHPAEDLRPSQESREKLSDLVRGIALPANVKLVPSAAPVSSYALMDAASVVMVYTSTAGLEAALSGKQVLVAARVYYARRGFTREVDDRAALGTLLQEAFAGPHLADHQRELARRFAYLLLFRFLHDLPIVKQRPHTHPLLDPDEAGALVPGHSSDFDALMESLLDGGAFVPATERV